MIVIRKNGGWLSDKSAKGYSSRLYMSLLAQCSGLWTICGCTCGCVVFDLISLLVCLLLERSGWWSAVVQSILCTNQSYSWGLDPHCQSPTWMPVPTRSFRLQSPPPPARTLQSLAIASLWGYKLHDWSPESFKALWSVTVDDKNYPMVLNGIKHSILKLEWISKII